MFNAQLERLDGALKEKEVVLINRKGVIFPYDNARPTEEKLHQLGWDAYSSDIASFDYHLFLSMQKIFVRKHFNNEEYPKNALTEFFESNLILYY